MYFFFAGDTDKSIDVFIQDSSSTVGAGLSGLVYNSSGLKAYYRKGATGTVTQLTLATQTVGGAHSDGGFVETDATNMKGVYRLDLSDTIIASEGQAVVYLYGATNMAPVAIRLQVLSPTRGLAGNALPNAAADAAGGLPISDAGGLDLDAKIGALTFTVAGDVDVNVQTWGGTAISTPPSVNATQISGDSTAADTLELFAEALDQATGQLDSGTLASGTITAASIAADAIGASELAADAVAEIADAVWDEAVAGHVSAGTFGATDAAILADTNELQTDWVNGGRLDLIVDAILDDTGASGVALASNSITAAVIADGAIDRATFAADTGLQAIRSNTAQAGASGTITLDASASSTTDFYAGAIVYITGGTAVGQYGIITAYNGTTKVATVHQSWRTNPDNTSTFAIIARGIADTHLIDGQVLTAGSAITVGAYVGGTGAAALETTAQTIVTDTNELQTDWTNGGRLDLIVDAILDDTGTAGVVVASGSKTGYSLSTAGMDSVTLPANILTASALATDAVSEITSAVLTTAMTESYRGTGATATLAQACYEIIAHLGESAIVSTTKTLKKLDGSTTAKTYTLDSATTPTSITETT